MRVFGNRVLVRLIRDDDFDDGKLESGLYLPDISRAETHRAKVIDAGSDIIDWKVGDTVVFGEHAGIEMEPDVLVLAEHEIICGVNCE